MTRSPSRNMTSPKGFSFFSGAGGFSAACRARFRFAVPHSPRRVGEITWISWVGMPMLSGKRWPHSSTTVSTRRTGSRRGRKKKSASLRESSGSSPETAQ